MRPIALAVAACLTVGGCAPAETEPAYEFDLLPAEDWDLSPRTGWTRKHHEAFFARLLVGFMNNLSPYGGRTRYPGGQDLPAAMEGVSRMLFAIGAWLSDPENPAVVSIEGTEIDLVELSTRALLAATDPANPDYWGKFQAGWDQRHVEAAIVAEFLVRTKTRVWDQLSHDEQDQIMAWLEPAEDTLPGNWGLFLATRNAARVVLGYDAPLDKLDVQIQRMEADYAGDGWYFDSDPQRFDYYNSFVVHPSLDFLAEEIGDDDMQARTRARMRAYLSHLPYMSNAEGAPIMYGRSLAYTTALVTPAVVAEGRGYSSLAPGLSRRLVSGQLRFFLHDEIQSTEGILDEDHVLRRGWTGDNPHLLEDYIRPGSQYFAARVSQALAIPRDSPFWTDVELDAPADIGGFVHAIPAPGFVLVGTDDGHAVTLLNGGSNSEKASGFGAYKRLTYSTNFAFTQAADGRFPYDGLVIPSKLLRFDQARSAPLESTIGPTAVYVVYSVADEDGALPHEVRTLAFPHGGSVFRVSCIGTAGADAVATYHGGFALPAEPGMDLVSGTEPSPWGSRSSSRGSVLLLGLDGFAAVEDQPGFAGELGLSSVESSAVFPVLVASSARRCFVSLMEVSAAAVSPPDIGEKLPTISWQGDAASLSFPDGMAVVADVSGLPSSVTQPLGAAQVTGATRFARLRAEPLELELVGSDRIEDDQGELVAVSGTDKRLACEPSREGLRCRTAAGFVLRAPRPIAAVEARRVDGSTIDLSDSAILDAMRLHIDREFVESWAAAESVTFVDVLVTLH